MPLNNTQMDQRLRAAAWVWAAFLLATAAAVLVVGDDAWVQSWSQATQGAWFQQPVTLLTHYGMYPFYFLFIGVLVYGYRAERPDLRALGWGYILAQLIGSAALVRSLKILTGHARPHALAPGADAPHWIGPTLNSNYHSFPSGHTSDLFTGALFLAVLAPDPRVRALGFALAAAVSASRIAVNDHYPSDVLAAMLFAGLVSFAVLHWWVRPRLAAPGPTQPSETHKS